MLCQSLMNTGVKQPTGKDLVAAGQWAFRSWLKAIRDEYKITYGALADQAGIARSTLSRYNSGDATGLPDTTTISKIKAAFSTPMPDALNTVAPTLPGVIDAELVPADVPGDTHSDDPNYQAWLVGTTDMAIHGIIPGDTIIARSDVAAVDGDIVIVQLNTADRKNSSTVIRKFHQDMGLATITAGPGVAPRLVDNNSVIITAVLTELRRSRKAS